MSVVLQGWGCIFSVHVADVCGGLYTLNGCGGTIYIAYGKTIYTEYGKVIYTGGGVCNQPKYPFLQDLGS